MPIITDDHYYVTTSGEINKICEELFKNTDITYFTFARIYKTGVHATLLTNPDWLKHYWKHDYGDLVEDRLKEGMHLWTGLGEKFSKPVHEARMFFNMDYKVDLIHEHENFVDLFGFATRPGNDRIIEFYLNKQEYLKKFSLYFYSVAGPLINEAVKEKHLLRFNNFDRESVNLHPDKEKLNLVLRKFCVPDADLTWRELQTSMLYIRGRSWDEIAKSLGIHPDTARSYLKEAKAKLGTKSKSAFFDKAFLLGLHTIPVDYILGIKK